MGGQEPMLVTLDSLEGLRAWRDFLVSSRKSLGARGCPIGSLGSELVEANTDVRARIAASFRAARTRSAPGCAACKPAASWGRAVPGELASAALAPLEGWLLLTQGQRGTKPLEISLAAMVALIVHEAAARAWLPRRPARAGPA